MQGLEVTRQSYSSSSDERESKMPAGRVVMSVPWRVLTRSKGGAHSREANVSKTARWFCTLARLKLNHIGDGVGKLQSGARQPIVTVVVVNATEFRSSSVHITCCPSA